MDQVMQEAREADLLHGKLGRTLFGNYEGHRESVWLQRGATAVIVGIFAGMISVFLGLPRFISYVLTGICFFIFIVCFVIAIAHLFRWIGYASGYKPIESDEMTRAPSENEPDEGDQASRRPDSNDNDTM